MNDSHMEILLKKRRSEFSNLATCILGIKVIVLALADKPGEIEAVSGFKMSRVPGLMLRREGILKQAVLVSIAKELGLSHMVSVHAVDESLQGGANIKRYGETEYDLVSKYLEDHSG